MDERGQIARLDARIDHLYEIIFQMHRDKIKDLFKEQEEENQGE